MWEHIKSRINPIGVMIFLVIIVGLSVQIILKDKEISKIDYMWISLHYDKHEFVRPLIDKAFEDNKITKSEESEITTALRDHRNKGKLDKVKKELKDKQKKYE